MYDVVTPEVVYLKRVRDIPEAAARMDRLMRHIRADCVTEVDGDAELATLAEERGWSHCEGRTGAFRMDRHPTIIFNAFRWLDDDAFEKLLAQYPGLNGMMLGQGAWGFRDHKRFRAKYGCVCQSAWEVHCANGCLHACDYCHIKPFYNIMLNLEELAVRLREFGETIPDQNLYKFDNLTDTICLEPEYGASQVMVETFADWPGRYLLLYTKSDNVDHLLPLAHNEHTLVSWSLNCATAATMVERGTPGASARIDAMVKCEAAGYPIRVRISPMVPVQSWREEYDTLIDELLSKVTPEVISVDVVGWMQPSQMMESLDVGLFDADYAHTLGEMAREGVEVVGKHLFPHAMRADMMRHVIDAVHRRRPSQPVSLCMETLSMWDELGPLTRMTPSNYACCCGPTSVAGHPHIEP